MSSPLQQFQDAFVAALEGAPGTLAGITEQPGFAVYRNTVLKGRIDALCANFPAVERLTGRDWLAGAAAIHARQTPPNDARLVFYGEQFPAFLDQFEPARALPYLGAVARLDQLWREAFTAPHQPRLALVALASLPASELGGQCLRPAASTRWQWFAGQPIYTLWHCNHQGLPLPEALPWQGEGALFVGHPEQVCVQPLSAGGCAFLEACAGGHSLDHASTYALQVEPTLDFTPLMANLANAGALAALDT